MRPIDADALKNDLSRFYDGEVTARQLIDEQPTIGGWISVKDRLPEKDGSYLVYGATEAMRELIQDKAPIWLCDWVSAYGGWVSLPDCMVFHFITYWMPLPEPPKEEKHND